MTDDPMDPERYDTEESHAEADRTPGPELPERREVPTHPTVKVHLMEDTGDWARDVVQIMARQDVAGTLAYMTVTDVDPARRNEWCRHRLVMQVMDREEQIGVDDSTAQLFGLTIPENLAKALHEALEGRYGTNAAAALRTAEDMLEERDTELREAAVELTERTLERDRYEAETMWAKGMLDAREAHLADVRQALGLERDRTNALTAELFGVREKLERAQAALESLRTPQRVLPGVITLQDAEDAGARFHVEPTPDPWATCGHISAEGIGGQFQPSRRCILPVGIDNHRTIGDRPIHSDGTYGWLADGTEAGSGYTTKGD